MSHVSLLPLTFDKSVPIVTLVERLEVVNGANCDSTSRVPD